MKRVAWLFWAFLLFGTTVATGQSIEPQDAVVLDDQIILGGLCVGPDCAIDGTEALNPDVFKLKNQYNRILFDDTSATEGFAANDWMIVTNDAVQWGDNYFSIWDATIWTVPFKIMAGAPDSTLFLSSDRKIGMGTDAPAYALHVQRTGENAAIVVDRTDGAINYINATADYGNFGTVNNKPLRFMVNGSWRGRINTDNSWSFVNGAALSPGGVWTNASSRDLKQEIAPLTTEAAMAALDGLTPVTYAYTADPSDTRVGFIAEEVPALVAEPDRKGLSPMDVVAVLTRVVQEQQRTIDTLNAKVDRLEGMISGQ